MDYKEEAPLLPVITVEANCPRDKLERLAVELSQLTGSAEKGRIAWRMSQIALRRLRRRNRFSLCDVPTACLVVQEPAVAQGRGDQGIPDHTWFAFLTLTAVDFI